MSVVYEFMNLTVGTLLRGHFFFGWEKFPNACDHSSEVITHDLLPWQSNEACGLCFTLNAWNQLYYNLVIKTFKNECVTWWYVILLMHHTTISFSIVSNWSCCNFEEMMNASTILKYVQWDNYDSFWSQSHYHGLLPTFINDINVHSRGLVKTQWITVLIQVHRHTVKILAVGLNFQVDWFF